MATQADQERCHRCGHKRTYHDPNCTFESASEICTCIGFVKMRIDPESARRNVDELFRQAALKLSATCSSDEKVKQEMHEAVDRIMEETKGD